MKTELIHSYSTASLSALAKSDSSLSLNAEFNPGGFETTPTRVIPDNSSKVDLIKAVAKEWWTKTARRKTASVSILCRNLFNRHISYFASI